MSDDEAPVVASSRKNAPSQQSSKRAVSTFRIAPGLQPQAQRASRDPRFDPSNSFDEAGWRKSYDFVFEQQREELNEQKRALKRDAKQSKGVRRGGKKHKGRQLTNESAAELRLDVERTENRLKADQRKVEEQRLLTEAKRSAVAKVKEGGKPFFVKKSVLREQKLFAKFEELQKKGTLNKVLAKKRKRLSGDRGGRRAPEGD